jgi:2',3'-cyclic-nucleotide 2'-phosphodiesterase (5'-nucleotidase family)
MSMYHSISQVSDPSIVKPLASKNRNQYVGRKLPLVCFNDVYDVNRMAQFTTVLKGFLKRYPNAVGLFGGDVLSPSVESRATKGLHMIDGLNYVAQLFKGRFVAVPGNHEFDFGFSNFSTALKKSRFSWVLANVVTDASTKKVLPPYVVLNHQGMKTLVYGLTLKENYANLPEHFQIKDPFAQAHQELTELRKRIRPDATILLAHLGEHTYNDIAKLPIDVAIVGHDHNRKLLTKNGIKIIRADADLETFAALTLQMKKQRPLWRRMIALMHDTIYNRLPSSRVERIEHQFIQVSPHTELDKGLMNRIDPKVSEEVHRLQESLFQAKEPLDVRANKIRGFESPISNLLTDAFRAGWNDEHPDKPVDMALIHAGNIRGDKIIPPKEQGFTLRNFYEVLPFRNPAFRIEMSGSMLQSILEHSLAHIAKGEIPNKHAGSFITFSGIRVEADLTKPYGKRILQVTTLNGKPLEATKTYAIVMDSFILQKDAGFPMLHEYANQHPNSVYKDSKSNSDYIKSWLLKQKKEGISNKPTLDGRLQKTSQVHLAHRWWTPQKASIKVS